MRLYRLKKLLRNIKYSFLKYFGYEDAWQNVDTGRQNYPFTVYVYGKRHENVKIKKLPDDAGYPDGWYPWYVEYPDKCVVNISGPDEILYLPWSETKEGKAHWKRIRGLKTYEN